MTNIASHIGDAFRVAAKEHGLIAFCLRERTMTVQKRRNLNSVTKICQQLSVLPCPCCNANRERKVCDS